MIKTLIVDDSPLARAILKNLLESSGSFEVAGEAGNGQEGIKMAKELSPDLITMDIEMPIMNGMDAIVEIRKFSSCGIVVISSNDTARMAYEAIANGAHEFISKDILTSKMKDEQCEKILDILTQITKIKKVNLPGKTETQDSIAKQKINAVVIAASTGGPMALCQLCSMLPVSFPVPVLLVQHNTSGFDRSFVQWLNEYSHLDMHLAEEGQAIFGGNIYVAPTDRHLVIQNNLIAFDNSDPVNNQKPAADILFKSASETFKDSLISIVLTGMGCDGAEGTRYVKQAGGITIAQDEKSSMIYGMPLAAFETGCVDIVLPLNEIAGKLVSLTTGSR